MSGWIKKRLASRASQEDLYDTSSSGRFDDDRHQAHDPQHHHSNNRQREKGRDHSHPSSLHRSDQIPRDNRRNEPSDHARSVQFQLPRRESDFEGSGAATESKVKELRNHRMEVQKKTFTKWCNVQLAKVKGKGTESLQITDLSVDLRDGIRLGHLLEVLSGETLPRPERTRTRGDVHGVSTSSSTSPTVGGGALMRIYSLVNVDKCLKFLATRLREPLSNIGSEDLVDGNLKLTLGLIWTLISIFRLERVETVGVGDGHRKGRDVSSRGGVEGTSASRVSSSTTTTSPTSALRVETTSTKPIVGGKAALLHWCQQILAPYVELGILPSPQNFSDSWQSGIAFLCLVHTFDPSAVPDVSDVCYRRRATSPSSSRGSRPSSAVGSAGQNQRAFSPDFSSPTETGFGDDEQWLKTLYGGGGHHQQTGKHVLASSPTRPTSGSSAHSSPRSIAPDVLNTSTSNPRDWRNNLARAFALAEEHMGIAALLDPQDLANVERPDEMVVMTYVSELYWILKGRPLPSPSPNSTTRSSVHASSSRQELPEPERHCRRLVNAFLHHANRALAWILKQQQATGALEGMLEFVASNEVTKLIIPAEGWVKPIMEAMMYEDSDGDRVQLAVKERIQHMHEQIRLANGNGNADAKTGATTWTRESLKALDDVTGGSIVPVVHQLYREIRKVTREMGPSLSPDVASHLSKVEEKHADVRSRLGYFSDQYFPDRDVVLRAYLVWMETWVRKVDAMQEELLGVDGKHGLHEEVRRLRKQAVELEFDMTRIRAELNRLGTTEDRRRVNRRIKTLRKVVQERLGIVDDSDRSPTGDGDGDGNGNGDDDEKQSPEVMIVLLQRLATNIEESYVKRVEKLHDRASNLVAVLSREVVDRRIPQPTDTEELHGEVFRPRSSGRAAKAESEPIEMSYNFLPVFLVWRGRGLVEAATEGILTYLEQSVSPILTSRQGDITSLIRAAEDRRADEEERERPIRTAAIDATREYCTAVKRMDRAVKMWKDELAERVREGQARVGSSHDEIWVRESEKWCRDRAAVVRQALGETSSGNNAGTPRSSQTDPGRKDIHSIPELDATWEMVVKTATREVLGNSHPHAQAFASAVPHQYLRTAVSALLDSMALFRSDALERVRGVVEKKREAMLAQWESSTNDIERVLRGLGGESEAMQAVSEAAETAVRNSVRGRQQMVKGMVESQRWDVLINISEAGLSAVGKDRSDVQAFLTGMLDRCSVIESDATKFEQARWTPFLVRTEALLQGCGTDSGARNRIEKRHEVLKDLANETRRSRASVVTAVTAHQRTLGDAYVWFENFLSLEQEWLKSARELDGEYDATDSEQQRLLAAMRTVIYNTAHGQAAGQQEAYALHESTRSTLEHQVTVLLGESYARVSEGLQRDGVGNAPEILRFAMVDLKSGRSAIGKSVCGKLKEGQSRIGARETTVRNRLVLENSIGRFNRDATAAMKGLRDRLDSERRIEVPHGLDLVNGDEADDSGGTDWIAAVGGLRKLAVECVELARKDSECDFVPSAIEKTLKDVQSLVDDIQDILRSVEEAHADAEIVAQRIGIPGHKIENACREIEAAVREVAGAAADDSGIGGGALAIVENIRVLADRASGLALQVDDVERALVGGDDRSAAYVRDLRAKVDATRSQTEEAGRETVKAVAEHWMTSVASTMDAWVTSVESSIQKDMDAGDTNVDLSMYVRAEEDRFRSLGEELQPLGPKLKNFETATEAAIRVIREWEARTADARHRHQRPVSYVRSDPIQHPEAIQARYVEIRARADSLQGASRQGVAFARVVAEFAGMSGVVEEELLSLEKDGANEDELEGRLTDLERVRINDKLAVALDEVHAAAANDQQRHSTASARTSTSSPSRAHRHPRVVQACTVRFESILDHVQRIRGAASGTRRARDAVEAYLTQATEVKTWVDARIENLAVVTRDVDDECARVMKSVHANDASVQEIVATAASRSVDRESGLAAAEAALERYNRAYEHLKSYARTVVEGFGAQDPNAAQTVLAEQERVDDGWRIMRDRLTVLRKRVEWNRRVFMWAKRCDSQVLGGIAHAHQRIVDGSAGGDVGGPGSGSGDDAGLEGVDSFVDTLSRAAVEEVRIWSDQMGAVLGLVPDLQSACNACADKEARTAQSRLLDILVAFYSPRLKEQAGLLADAADHRTSALHTWAGTIREFLAGVSDCEPWVEGAIKELRERLYARKPGPNVPGSRGTLKAESQRVFKRSASQTSLLLAGADGLGGFWSTPAITSNSAGVLASSSGASTSQHLTICGDDVLDRQNLDDWTAGQQRLEKRLTGELASKMQLLQTTTTDAVLRECEAINLPSALTLAEEVRERLEDLCEKWREANRLAGEEKAGIERARTYLEWHSRIARIEADFGQVEKVVKDWDEGPSEVVIDEAGVNSVMDPASSIERALNEFVQMTEEEQDSVPAPPVMTEESASELETQPSMASLASTSHLDVLRRPKSLATLQVVGLAQQVSASVLRKRADDLAAKIARVTAKISERKIEAGQKRRMMTVLEEVGRLGGWCDRVDREIAERRFELPPRALLEYSASRTSKRGSPSGDEAETASTEPLAESVQTTIKELASHNAHAEHELGTSRSALVRLEEHMDPNTVKSLTARFGLIEKRLGAERIRIDASTRLCGLDRSCVQVSTWIATAVQASQDIAESQSEIRGIRRQSVVIDEQLGYGDGDDPSHARRGSGHRTAEEVVELEDRVKVYENTVTALFNAASLASDQATTAVFSGDEEAATAYRTAISRRVDAVRADWEFLISLVSRLRGSSDDRRRETEFNDEVEEISRGIAYVRQLVGSGQDEADVDFDKWNEAEDLLDGRMVSRVAALGRRADATARDGRERNRFLAKHRTLEKRVRELLDLIEARHVNADSKLMVRRIRRLEMQLETRQGEFMDMLQKATAGAAVAAGMAEGVPLPAPREMDEEDIPMSPTEADPEAVASALEAQWAHQNVLVTELLDRLRIACEATDDTRVLDSWRTRWNETRDRKQRIAADLRRWRGSLDPLDRSDVGSDLPSRSPSDLLPEMHVGDSDEWEHHATSMSELETMVSENKGSRQSLDSETRTGRSRETLRSQRAGSRDALKSRSSQGATPTGSRDALGSATGGSLEALESRTGGSRQSMLSESRHALESQSGDSFGRLPSLFGGSETAVDESIRGSRGTLGSQEDMVSVVTQEWKETEESSALPGPEDTEEDRFNNQGDEPSFGELDDERFEENPYEHNEAHQSDELGELEELDEDLDLPASYHASKTSIASIDADVLDTRSSRSTRGTSPRRSNLPIPTRSRSITPTRTPVASRQQQQHRQQTLPARPPLVTKRHHCAASPEPPHSPVARNVRVYIPSPNAYKADPNDPLDAAIGKIVNAHPLKIKIQRSLTEPGRYWFGDVLRRLCFCRLVRRTVMVRIGGGWQELGTFLADHTALELRIPTVRSFSHPEALLAEDKLLQGKEQMGTRVVERDSGDTSNPYSLTTASGVAATTTRGGGGGGAEGGARRGEGGGDRGVVQGGNSPVMSPRRNVARALAKVAAGGKSKGTTG
ncbi:Spectrin beta chain, non-erythrocytic 4 [Thoreauomyces humboldtii]|nr:Spectrin beta chain, non-erythrocytic 4 [Thoreauomyces humboldtii]